MTAGAIVDPLSVTGYRLDQLAAAFDRVMNPRDWKAPISAVIPATDRLVVEQAVIWFTRTVPVFVQPPGVTDRIVVTAPGFRLGPDWDPERSPSGSRSEELRIEPFMVSDR